MEVTSDIETNDTVEINEDYHVTPRLGMKFQTLDEAWVFWNYYGGTKSFSARKGKERKSTVIDGVITSKVFYCSCEGKRRKDKRDPMTKDPRAETRTDCKVNMRVSFQKSLQNYKVVGFVSKHNHPLHKPAARYLMRSQRKVSQVASIDIQLADSSGIVPKAAHELQSRQVGGIESISFTEVDRNNCLRNHRKEVMKYGSAVAITKYFARREIENPSFKHYEDTNEEQEISNIVWTDGIMIASYARFGDVVIFDTTFGTNKEKWAFGVFVGFNHFREIVIFGAALMFDQSKSSFEWVFARFLEAHGGKKPITIFTDQDKAMGGALETVMPDTRHGLCVWHIGQNCQKHLMCYNKKDMNVTGDFSACMFRYEEISEFEFEFSKLKRNLGDKVSWLNFIYESKEKWAFCFMKDAYTLGIRSTQASESINSNLKGYLNATLNIPRFVEHFNRVLDANRKKVVVSDFNMTSKLPRIKLGFPILCEAGKVYTPKIFELFQAEFELMGLAQIDGQEGNTYTIGMYNIENETQEKSRQVTWNRDDQIISCPCKKFEREGLMCCHALRVLFQNDVKVIPSRYILKRWTRVAEDDEVVDIEGRSVTKDAMLEIRNRHGNLFRQVTPLFAEASQDETRAQYLSNEIQVLIDRYEKKYENLPRSSDEVNPTSQNSLHLKKKIGGDRRSKRHPPWNEKVAKTKKSKGKNIANSQDSLRPSTNLSQGLPENFGCYGNLEDLHNLEITLE